MTARCHLRYYYPSDQFEEKEVGRTCGTYGRGRDKGFFIKKKDEVKGLFERCKRI
jgi:hypothetical protein